MEQVLLMLTPKGQQCTGKQSLLNGFGVNILLKRILIIRELSRENLLMY